MVFSAGTQTATSGAPSACVAAGGGMLDHLRRRVSVQVRMGLTGLESAALSGAQHGSMAHTSSAGIKGMQPHRLAVLARPCQRAGGPR